MSQAASLNASPNNIERLASHDEESGSALPLFVVGFLAVLMLVGTCVDSALVFLGQREIANAANAAANDAVSGINVDAYYGEGNYALADDLATYLSESSWKYTTHDQVSNVQLEPPKILGPTSVSITVKGDVELLFAKAFPFVPSVVTVRASAIAEAQGQVSQG